MRRTIALTGRQKIAAAKYSISIAPSAESNLVIFSATDTKWLNKFPADSLIRIHLRENGIVEALNFGTTSKPTVSVVLPELGFSAPAATVRVVSNRPDGKAKVLASSAWRTIKIGDSDQDDPDGILNYIPANIAPRIWKLEIYDDDYPTLKIDKSITTKPEVWALNDPVFTGAVLPAVIEKVWNEILSDVHNKDVDWIKDWIKWADTLLPGSKPPYNNKEEKPKWISDLVESFCKNHNSAKKLKNYIGD